MIKFTFNFFARSEFTTKIFVASSGELNKERQQTIIIVHNLREAFPTLNLEAVEWETNIPSSSYDKERIQDEINPLLEQCPIVIVLFYSKIGKLTLEEHHLARAKNKKVFIYSLFLFQKKNDIRAFSYYINFGGIYASNYL